ncbi:4347_t:CDS:2 [Ambispora leptoticha]|uniref:4347_t:CDS:1 n=1 Tax=Ambispora leptoticha TaxID=144679 RepID=A0A9N9E9T2_9GLOM|nr:4347_t:CDS:2 [Ambispora leptoticha]
MTYLSVQLIQKDTDLPKATDKKSPVLPNIKTWLKSEVLYDYNLFSVYQVDDLRLLRVQHAHHMHNQGF